MQFKRTDRSSSFPTSLNPLPVNPATHSQNVVLSPSPIVGAAPLSGKKRNPAPVNSRLTAAILTEFVQQGLKDAEIAERTGYSTGYIKNCRHAFGLFHQLPKNPEGGARPVRLCREQSVWGRVAGATAAKCLAGQRYTDDPQAQAPEGLWRVPRPATPIYTTSSADWAVTATPEEEEFLADMAPPPVSPPKLKR